MKRKLTEDFIKQNLKDAGCDGDTIDCILECCVNGNIKKRKKVISQHRKKLLEQVHEGQRQIDCLDYFSYRIEDDELSREDKKEEEDEN